MAAGGGRFRILYVGPSLKIGVSDACQVTIPAVAKQNCKNTPYCIPNEIVCGELGRFLGLPIPPGAVVLSPNGNQQLFYASLDFNLAGQSLPPVNTTDSVKHLPKECTGLLLFDIYIANADRHGRNFAVDFARKPPVMSIFDHGHALFGKDAGQGVARLKKLRNRLGISAGSMTAGNRHCLLDQLRSDEYFGFWLDRIRQIPDFVIDDLCQELEGLGCLKEEARAASEFLKERKTSLDGIIANNRDEFTGIKSWRLFR